MQQPLCHLYFLLVMEHVWSKYHDSQTSQLSALTRSVCNIQNELDATTAEEEQVLMNIELQAVIQMLIQCLATHLVPKGGHGKSDYHLILEDINKLVASIVIESTVSFVTP